MAYLPMGDTNTYDRFGKVYNISRILNPDITLNHEAYEEYSAMYLSPPYISYYLLTFAISTCIISHTLLYHGRTLWNSFRNIDPEEDDIHAKLMKVYPEVPNWWYWIVIGGFFLIAAISVQVCRARLLSILKANQGIKGFPNTNANLRTPFVTRSPSCLYTSRWSYLCRYRPIGAYFSSGNRRVLSILQLSLNVLAQVIPGALLPGNPIANMVRNSSYYEHKTNQTPDF